MRQASPPTRRAAARGGERARALGMKVWPASRWRSAPPASQPFAWAELDELFHVSDVISLHCPLTAETAGLVNRERLQRVRPGAFLVNTSRGGLGVEADLADALDEGRLAGAAADVVARGPGRRDNPPPAARHGPVTADI